MTNITFTHSSKLKQEDGLVAINKVGEDYQVVHYWMPDLPSNTSIDKSVHWINTEVGEWPCLRDSKGKLHPLGIIKRNKYGKPITLTNTNEVF